ncbi:nuclear transport factor 2 family protein [Roseivirga sp. BDSF3-8]|uniref:nuclear transport factor 2 family protein n=1 Tax=Roseivirga sp. BDSF3-8 TaxID=3241598 RepID=UPI0035326FA6
MKYLLLTVCLLFCLSAKAQNMSLSPAEVAENSLKSLEGLKGVERDWDSFRSYFTPDVRISLLRKSTDGEEEVRHLTLEEFIEKAGANYLKNGFYEYPVTDPVVHTYGQTAVVWQPYAIKFNMEGEEIMRGINIYHLIQVNGQWRITFLTWEAQNETMPVTEWRESQE